MVPKLKLQFEPELTRLDELLDDDELFKLLKADLLNRYLHSAKLGRHSRRGDPEDAGGQDALRMELRAYPEHFVSDSIILRQFCRLYLQSTPDDTTLIRWVNTIGP